ncbi:hypothetical protein [uncultured Alistipes sp.]|uniref:hypothetical protein n=1 Tax=uncultured Alistipes sp. TaxID=538949 RepID=UPI00261CA2E3|nr:hypothetical protein [uncultured Alistipes sp.]
MKLLLLLSLAATAAAALGALWLMRRGRAARALFDTCRTTRGDAPGDLGISILCAGVESADEVERLLSLDYPCSEVVAVVDAAQRPELFAALVSRYRMFRAGRGGVYELPDPGIRAIERSRNRCFRRLVLVDRGEDTAEGALDAAACIASYDYLLPLRRGERLRRDAVERLAAAVGEREAGEVELVRTQPDGRVALVARERLVACGGFAGALRRCTPRGRRVTLWERLSDRAGAGYRRTVPAPVRGVAVGVLALAAGFTVAVQWWLFAALLFTAALVWTVAVCIDGMADEGAAGPSEILRAGR